MIASKQQLTDLAMAMHGHTGLELSTIATYGANDGKLFTRWGKGGSCTLRTAEGLLKWFSANWPVDLEWPRDVPRPTPTKPTMKEKAA